MNLTCKVIFNINIIISLIIHVAIELSVNHIGNNGQFKKEEETIVILKLKINSIVELKIDMWNQKENMIN
jgi:hypothetical protein